MRKPTRHAPAVAAGVACGGVSHIGLTVQTLAHTERATRHADACETRAPLAPLVGNLGDTWARGRAAGEVSGVLPGLGLSGSVSIGCAGNTGQTRPGECLIPERHGTTPKRYNWHRATLHNAATHRCTTGLVIWPGRPPWLRGTASAPAGRAADLAEAVPPGRRHELAGAGCQERQAPWLPFPKRRGLSPSGTKTLHRGTVLGNGRNGISLFLPLLLISPSDSWGKKEERERERGRKKMPFLPFCRSVSEGETRNGTRAVAVPGRGGLKENAGTGRFLPFLPFCRSWLAGIVWKTPKGEERGTGFSAFERRES